MSGTVTNNIFGVSGLVVAAAGGLEWQPVVTASTVTVSSGKGYWINTTSNACTITLPSSAEVGDQIIFGDYARTWATNAITIDSNGLNFQGDPDTYTVDYDTNGQAINIVYSGATKGWTPVSDIATAFEPVAPPTQKGIFAYGNNGSAPYFVSMSNLVNSSGVIATDVTGVGTARYFLASSSYGGDKALFAFGANAGKLNIRNLVNNSGVIASDASGAGTARGALAAANYGGDKGIFGYGQAGGYVSLSNLVSNSGVVASDTTGVGTARGALAACSYGEDLAIFGYGEPPRTAITNKVSNLGVIATDTTGVGTARNNPAAVSYGGDKGIFGFGYSSSATSLTNLVSNTGVVSADVTGVGTARESPGATAYGGDKAVFAYGSTGSVTSLKNLVSNSGVVASDVTGVGTSRAGLVAGEYSTSA